MGSVIQLKKQINNSYLDLKNSVEDKLVLVEEKIKNKLTSEVDLVQKISDYHLENWWKKIKSFADSRIIKTLWLFKRWKRY